MGKKFDFVLLCEVKARELENLCLLKYELNRRGYNVKILSVFDIRHDSYKTNLMSAKVVLTHTLYNNGMVRYMVQLIRGKCKVVSLNNEQVYDRFTERNKDSIAYLKDNSKNAVHLAWGSASFKRWVNLCGVASNNAKVVGHITLDFLRDELKNYYMDRSTLFKSYGIDEAKKVCLFVSTFAYVGMNKDSIDDTSEKSGYNAMDFVNISIESQKSILTWIKSFLNKNEEIIFIYRPHPTEKSNPILQALADEYKNFFVISDYSVKQWILCCDSIYTWYSTAITEIYVSKKNCYILRPVEIPEDMEIVLYKDAKFITSQVEFEASFDNQIDEFPIPSSMFDKYYSIDPLKPTYIKICDVLEDVIKNPEYKHINPNEGETLFSRVKYALSKTKSYRFLKFKVKDIIDKDDDYISELRVKNRITEDEIIQIINRIKLALE